MQLLPLCKMAQNMKQQKKTLLTSRVRVSMPDDQQSENKEEVLANSGVQPCCRPDAIF